MQITTETVSNTQTRLSITVPTTVIQKEYKKRLRDISKTAKIDGFRPGKVPMSHIESQYGVGVRQEVINDVIRDTVFEAITKEELRAIGTPNIEDVNLEEETLSYKAVVDLFPTVEITNLDTLTIEKQVATVNDDDVDTMIENLRKQRQTFAEKEGDIVDGDQAIFDFAGSIDGEAFEGGTATDFSLVVGSGRMIPGFEDGLVGMKAGDEKEITVTFPEDYQAEDLQGKEAQFKLNVKKVEEAVLPEIDAEFLKIFNIEDGGIDKLKAEVRKNMEREIKNAARNQAKQAAFDAVVDSNEIEIPQSMLDIEVERQRDLMIQRLTQQLGQGAGSIDKSMLPDELFSEQAIKSARLGVLVASLIDSNKIEVDQTRVDTYIQETAENYEDPAEVIEYYKNDAEQRAQIENVVMEDQVVDFILDKAQVTESEVSYQELLATMQAPAM